MEKQKKIRIAGVVAAVLFIAVAAAGSLSRSDSVRKLYQEPRVAVIRVNGPIVGGDDADMAWGSPSSTTSGALMRQFRKARQDDSVQAVLLRVNSPGGSAAATQEAAAELQKLKDSGKPVVVSMGDTATSGAYWLAAYGDKIYANPSTITGSIGVYMSYYDVQGLSEKLGVREEKIKSGPHKDIFSPFRPMTEEERRLTQRNDVVMGGNLKHAVCRRVDDGLLRTEMVRPEAFDDFRARRNFVADIAVACLCREQVHQLFGERVGKGRERVVYGISHEFPMAARRVLSGGNFLHEAVRACDICRYAVDMSDLS